MRTKSPLTEFVSLSPYCSSPRNHTIDTITIHCTAGMSTLSGLADTFRNPKRQCSANYAIDSNGKIGQYVIEGNRSWASSNSANDHRAITIEVVTESLPPYRCTEASAKALVGLLVDICREYHIPKILWKNDKTLIGHPDEQNVTLHRWFANTACPGDYLLDHFDNIFAEANKRLTGESENVSRETLYRVQVGAYQNRRNAEEMLARLNAAGFEGFITNGQAR